MGKYYRSDWLAASSIILPGLLFTLLIVIPNESLSPTGFIILGSTISYTLFGCWKLEKIKEEPEELTKLNFAGLYRRRFRLTDIVKVENKVIHNPFTSKFLILTAFSSNPKYTRFRIATIHFQNGQKMTFNELAMDSKEFSELYRTVKKWEKINRRREPS